MNVALKIVVFLSLVAIIALVGRSLVKKEEPQTVAPKHYTVRKIDLERSVYGSGVLRCSSRAEIASRAAGKITELLVKEGDAVKPLQELCKMSNDQLQNDFKAAQKDFEFAKKEYDDSKRSHAQGGPPSKWELDKMAWELEKKEKALEILREKVEALTVTVPPELSGTALKSYLKQSDINLDPDKVYPEGTPLFVIGDLSTLAVYGTILESDVDKVKQGDAAVVHLGKKGRLPAKVTYLSLIPSAASEGGRYDIHLEFEKPPSGINEGLTVSFRTIVEKKSNVLAVPVEYVEFTGGRHWVKKVVGEKVTRVPIEVGISSDSLYEVRRGLKEGDVIRWDAETTQ